MSDNNGLKPQYGWIVSFFLPFTPYVAKKTVQLRLSANLVSWLSLVVFLIGLYFYYQYNDFFYFRVLAVILFCLGTFLDVLDGVVARITNTSSKYGANLDSSIDLFRYNIFFLVVALTTEFKVLDYAALAVYVFLLNYSFYLLFYNRFKEFNHEKSDSKLEAFLPKAYVEFCLKYKLLYNPFNLEDQLLFMFFIVGVLFQIEVLVLYIALVFRLTNVAAFVFSKVRVKQL